MNEEYTLCLDIGTNTIKVVVLICNSTIKQENDLKIPSVVVFSEDGEKVHRKKYSEERLKSKDVVIKDFVPFVNLTYSSLVLSNLYMHNIIEGSDDYPKILVKGDKAYYPEEVLALLLEDVRKEVKALYNCEITDVVLSLPFDNVTTCATIISGLNLVLTIPVPVAIASAYERNVKSKRAEEVRKLLVIDPGISALRLYLISLHSDGKVEFEMKIETDWSSSEFTTHLYNFIVVTHFGTILSNRRKIEIMDECEKAKIKISRDHFCDIFGDIEVSRHDFERCIGPSVRRMMGKVKRFVGQTEISDVLLVGGSSKVPLVRKSVESQFDRNICDIKVDPENVIAYGMGVFLQMSNGVALA